MIYVDAPVTYQTSLRSKIWSHLWSDNLEELHAFARLIGLQRAWFQEDRRGGHYDAVPRVRQKAVANGAIKMEYRDWLQRKGSLSRSGVEDLNG